MNRRLSLAKVPLCLLISCSTVFGYVLADPVVAFGTFFTGFGIFILATGAATLNSLQECQLDSELERTRNRPLPKGLVCPSDAGLQAFVLLSVGLIIMFVATKTFLPVLSAVLAVILYNGVYTPLKKRTILAILPGAICGSFPPYIGWLSGGGEIVSYTGALLISLFFLWQVPHFWLVLLTFKQDYQRSSFPNFLRQFEEHSLRRFFVTWIGALIFVMLMFLTLPFPVGLAFRLAVIVNSFLLLFVFVYNLAILQACNYRILFIVLNCSLFLHMLIFGIGRIVGEML